MNEASRANAAGPLRIADLADRRVAVWGAGREGRAAIAAMRARLPDLVFDVLCTEAEAVALRELWEGTQPRLHRESEPRILPPEQRPDGARPRCVTAPPTLDSLSRYDVVVKSPGISPYRSPVPEAQAAGVRFVSGSALWFAEHGAARTIGITGTKGKSTTSALVAHLLRVLGRRVALCGNIGMPLLELLDAEPQPDRWVVELSSFQTRELPIAPEIAVVLNLYPEHLDWHGTYEHYERDKLAILGGGRGAARIAVLGPDVVVPIDDVRPAPFQAGEGSSIVHFGRSDGWHVTDEGLARGDALRVPWSALPLPGRHNALNACAALTVLEALGEDVDAALPALASFEALPHRLQPLGVREGIEYVDDSIATTPHATLAALAFFQHRKVTVLVGGHDRGVPWDVFRVGMESAPVHAVVTMGANGERIAQALAGLSMPRVLRAGPLEEAIAIARELTPQGGVVLLSPGAPSFGEFRDYVERGRRFAELAGFDPDVTGTIEGLGIA